MNRLIAKAQSAVDRLRSLPTDQLLTELGKRLAAVNTDPEVAGGFDLSSDYDRERWSPDDLHARGQRLFAITRPQAEGLLYGDAGSDECRSKLIDAFPEGSEATATALAAALVAEIGLSPVLAPVVGLLTLELFLKGPDGEDHR